MICDKCGFEHNSKSVCPKCGARVVYVNEEYQKRRKEWEESQKNQAIPPLIMHSTREDYDRRHGNDRTYHRKSRDAFISVYKTWLYQD